MSRGSRVLFGCSLRSIELVEGRVEVLDRADVDVDCVEVRPEDRSGDLSEGELNRAEALSSLLMVGDVGEKYSESLTG